MNIKTATADEIIEAAEQASQDDIQLDDMKTRLAFKVGYLSGAIRHLVAVRNELQANEQRRGIRLLADVGGDSA